MTTQEKGRRKCLASGGKFPGSALVDKELKKARAGHWKMNHEYKRTLGNFIGWY